jgi:hypothetical protein
VPALSLEVRTMRLKCNLTNLIAQLVVIGFFGALIGALLSSKRDFDLTYRYPPARPGYDATSVAGLAGDYYRGDGLGSNVRLSILSDGRYSLVSSGCTGVHCRESGFVQETNGHYKLTPAGTSDPQIKRDLALIGWGPRHYLIAADETQKFRDAIVEGVEPRDDLHGRFYVRLPIAPADGLPDSPAEWAKELRDGLLLGKVTKVSAAGLAKIGRANVDLGFKDGLRKGDLLTVQRPGYALERRLRVVSLADHLCVADECFPSASNHPLEPGMAVVGVRVNETDGRR